MPDKFGDKIRLQHVMDAVETINRYVSAADFATFSKNTMMMDACIRQLQIIGEACGKVSDELKHMYPDISWRQIVGLRIVVIHQYFGVDKQVIWDIIENDLAILKLQIEKILKELA